MNENLLNEILKLRMNYNSTLDKTDEESFDYLYLMGKVDVLDEIIPILKDVKYMLNLDINELFTQIHSYNLPLIEYLNKISEIKNIDISVVKKQWELFKTVK